MMKTLQQMEPRTHIENAGYVISVPGSYYLTANLNGGGTAIGIMVKVSGVTIDLRGFSIMNCPVGIATATGVRTVAVANGSISSCTGAGVDLSLAEQCRLEGVISSNNTGDGVSVGSGSIVTLCTAANNGGRGLVLGNGGTVFRCVAQTNGNSGIVIASNCQASENTCTGNGAGAGQAGLLTTGAGNRVEGNSANQNNGQGYQINGTGNLVIRNNACSNSVADYSMGAGNNFGQILLSPGSNFSNTNAWANFGCGSQPAACQGDGDCNDANTCTTDACVAGSCVHTPIAGCGACASAVDCDDGNACTDDSCQGGSCVHTPIAGCGGTPVCGNNVLEAGEQCDDGNTVPGDGCSATCQTEGANGVCTNGSTQACYSGPAGSSGVGACHAGTQTCSGGAWGACVGEATPNTEVCDDGIDNDCDGMVDEGCVATCGNGLLEAGETCDDGNLTNGDGCTATCTVQSGYSCTGSPSVCTPITFPLVVSKSGSGSGTVTSAPAGISCGGDCAENYSSGTPVTLTATANPGSTFAGWSGACAGTGTCTVTMSAATSVMATFTSTGCTPSTEVCDGLDNDCDSLVDEGDPGGGGACGTGMLGVCSAGTVHCQGGTLVCAPNANPSAEVCGDGIDNDCDGVVDEGCGATGSACVTASNCASGVCTGGTCHAPSCSDGVKNGTETGVDCGGGTCSVCAPGQTCNVGPDCSSGHCTSGVCQP